jgi:multiple sugar transport system substrate-binding protein
VTLPARRLVLRRAAAALAAAGLAGCTRKGSAPTLRFWAMGREGEVAHELLREFHAEHPGLEVRIERLPWTSAHEKLLTAFAGDATPDVAQMGNTWLAEMAAVGALEPLQSRLDATPSIERADHFPGIWDTNTIDGRLVGIPWYVDTRLLFVRRDLLARSGIASMPRTWSAWRTALSELHEAGAPSPVLLPLNEFEPLLALALQQPDELLRDGGRYGNFSSAGFQRALAFYLEMFERGWAPYLSSTQVGNVWQEFGRGTFAFYISGPWNIGEFRRRLGAEAQPSWTTAPMPGPDGPGASTAGGSSLVVFRRSTMKREAWQLIEYLSRPAVQQRFYALTGNLPPRRSSWAHPSLAGDEQARAFAEQLERVRAAPAVPEWERIANEMQHYAARAVHDKATPEAVGRALDARVDGFLEKRRWMMERAAQRA